ncbi:MAG: hypothetical protein GTO62_14350, partial [Planctomycetales bacterium]|nr:hypothetical protein [Planctomycetales bacterium]NIP70410.1 hypothetical protein [Planctomycetales bacterium]
MEISLIPKGPSMAWLYSCLCWTGCLLAPPTLVADQRLERFEFTQVHMGSELNLTFYAADRQSATAAAQAAFARVGELNERLSDYLPDSEL